MDAMQIFKNDRFGEVRVVKTDGEPMIVAVDVARALGYKDPKDAVATHCKSGEVVKCRLAYVPHSNGVGGTNLNVINEGNVYRLIMRSDLPNAEDFQDWVCGEVLPSIRKHGGYIAAGVDDTPDVIMARAVLLAQDTLARVEADKQRLLLTTQEQAKQLKEAAPKVQYYDDTLCSKSRLPINSIALCLGITHIKLNKLLCQWNVQYRQGDVYFLHAKYRDLGLAKHHPFPYVDSSGVNHTRQHLYWNEAGKKFILELYAKKTSKAA